MLFKKPPYIKTDSINILSRGPQHKKSAHFKFKNQTGDFKKWATLK